MKNLTKAEIKQQINIASFWYECVLYDMKPKSLWDDVKKQFNKPPVGPQYLTV